MIFISMCSKILLLTGLICVRNLHIILESKINLVCSNSFHKYTENNWHITSIIYEPSIEVKIAIMYKHYTIHARIMYCLINLHGAKVIHCPIIVPQRTINVNTNTQLGCLSQMIKNITSDNVINVVKMTTTYLGKCARQILPVRKEDIPENKAYTIVMYPTI